MSHPQRTRGGRVAAGTIALATAILIAAGVTGATADSKTTNVAITPLTPVKTVTTGVSVAAGKTYAFVGSGGSTTVPTNALVIRVAITVKGVAGGTLSFAPLGDPAGASPTKVTWPAGGTGSGTVNVNLGTSNKVVVSNGSTGSATVGVKITGYSTQVAAAGIDGSGGTSGQVLTNNGDGTVAWKSPAAPPAVPVVLRAHVQSFGGVELGQGVTASRQATGQYLVTFPRPMAGCVVTGSPGAYDSGQWALTATITTSVHPTSPSITVYARRPDVSAVDTDFSLIAVC